MANTRNATIEHTDVATGLAYAALVEAFEAELGRWDAATAQRLVQRNAPWSEVEAEASRAGGARGLMIIETIDRGGCHVAVQVGRSIAGSTSSAIPPSPTASSTSIRAGRSTSPSASAFTTMAVRPARTFPTIVPALFWRRSDTRSWPPSARNSTKRSTASRAPSAAAAPTRSKGLFSFALVAACRAAACRPRVSRAPVYPSNQTPTYNLNSGRWPGWQPVGPLRRREKACLQPLRRGGNTPYTIHMDVIRMVLGW